MALTRAQYLAPGGGINALTGQVQGVKQGSGVSIATDGTISFDAGTATGVVTSISGGTTGLTFSGNPAGLWTMAGTLAIGSGGTGSNTSTGGINNLLPSQAGNAGRYLRTDGSNVSWAVADALPPQAGNAGLFLTTNGTIAAWAPVPPGPIGPLGPTGPTGPTGPIGPPGVSDIPVGTRMVFYQASAPTGWTQVTDAALSDAAIRLVTGGGAGSGGSQTFSSAFTSYTPSGNVNTGGLSVSGGTNSAFLDINQSGAHSHTYSRPSFSIQGAVGASPDRLASAAGVTLSTNSAGGNGGHSHGIAASLAGTANYTGSATSQFSVKYVDFIVASRN